MKEIILKFNTIDGESRIEANGFTGQSCSEATEFLKKSLGQAKDFKKKAEWYQVNLEKNGQINSNLCG